MRHHKLLRLVSIGAAALAFTGTLAACGSPSSGSTDTANGKVYYLNFKPEVADAWKALATEYTNEKGVQVTVQTAASGTYETTLKSEMAKTDAPTLFQVNGPVGLDTWKDYASDLSDTAIYKDLTDQNIALKSSDGQQVLAVPFAMETYGIIYNKALLAKYFALPDAAVKSVDQITSFDALKKVSDGIQANKSKLGVEGAFTSAGFDSSSDWRFHTHLANVPLYYEYKADNVTGQPATIKGTYLPGFKNIFDLYLTDSTTKPSLLSSKTIQDANSEFALGKAIFYQNGTWAYNDIKGKKVADADMGMLPIFIGAPGEEKQGLCTGSENYWVINSNASDADKAATKAFLEWVITSDKGREALSKTMGFVTPFNTFADYQSTNPLVLADAAYQKAGKTPVSWNFTTMPSQNWKTTLGQAMLQYAQGTGNWDAVKKAFVDNWATEYKLAHS